MRTVATTTAIILKSMLPPREREISSAACARSGGPGLGNFEGAAIDRSDIEDFARLAGGAVRDLRVPERVAVFHASVARAFVDPGVESGRLAEIQPLHALRRQFFLVLIHPDHPGDSDDRRADRLPHQRAARVADPRADQGRDAENEQVKRARHQLGNDEDKAGDQPGEGNVHGRCGALSAGYRIAPDGLGSSAKTLDYVYNAAAYDGHVAGQRYSGDTGIRDPLPPESSPSPEGRE